MNSRKASLLPPILFYSFIMLFWQLIISYQIIPDYIFPSPLGVLSRIYELFSDGYLLPSIKATIGRMLIGYLLAASLGIFLGAAMGVNATARQCLKSLFLGLLTLPTAAWAPISLIFFGLSDRAIDFVIVMSAMPAVAISTAEAIHSVPALYVKAGLTLGTPKWAMPIRVMLPAALPRILTGVKLGWTLGWHGAVSAELIKSSVGLGYLLHMGRELNDAPQVIGIMLITIIIGVLIDQLVFRVIERKVYRRRGLSIGI